MATASASHFSRDSCSSQGCRRSERVGHRIAQGVGVTEQPAMHLKWLQWGQSVPLQVAVSLHTWLPGEGRGPRGEAGTVARAGAGNRQPGLSQGDGAETGGRALHRGRRWPLCLSATRGGQEARPPGRAQVSPGLGGPRTVHRAAVISAPWGQSWENPGAV